MVEPLAGSDGCGGVLRDPGERVLGARKNGLFDEHRPERLGGVEGCAGRALVDPTVKVDGDAEIRPDGVAHACESSGEPLRRRVPFYRRVPSYRRVPFYRGFRFAGLRCMLRRIKEVVQRHRSRSDENIRRRGSSRVASLEDPKTSWTRKPLGAPSNVFTAGSNASAGRPFKTPAERQDRDESSRITPRAAAL